MNDAAMGRRLLLVRDGRRPHLIWGPVSPNTAADALCGRARTDDGQGWTVAVETAGIQVCGHCRSVQANGYRMVAREEQHGND